MSKIETILAGIATNISIVVSSVKQSKGSVELNITNYNYFPPDEGNLPILRLEQKPEEDIDLLHIGAVLIPCVGMMF